MKKSTKILFGIGSVVVAVVAVMAVLGVIDTETAVGVGALMCSAPVGFVGADAAHTSTPTVGADGKVDGSVKTYGKGADGSITHPEMNKPTISQKLAKVLPSNYPLDTLLRNIGSGKTNSDKYGFYSIIARGVKAVIGKKSGASAVNTTAALGATTTLYLSSGVHCLSKDGDLLVPSYNVSGNEVKLLTAGKALNPLILHIVDIDYAKGEIAVMGVNGAVPVFAENTAVYRMASAKDQEAAMSNDPMATPVKEFNFVQRNLCTISENAFQALQDKEVQYGLAEFKEQALLDFRYQAEISSLFGAAYAENDGEMIDKVSQKRKLHMKGLTSFIGTQIQRGKGQTIPAFLNAAMEKLFANNNGSEERIILYGAEFATALANDAEAWKKQIEGAKTEVKWGITWKVIETNFGRLLGLMHTGLGMVGYGDCAFVVDPANIRRINQLELTQTELDLKKAGYRNSKDITLDEAWTLEVTNPSCHGMLVITEAAA